MRYLVFLSLFLLGACPLFAQVTSTASGDSGSGYPALISSGFQIEDPDCVHTDFGPHVTQQYDAELDRNVFVFHSHIEEDNDRCQVFDRVRMEIKGSANTIPELRHGLGTTSWYRWKFRLDENFIGASSFTHLFQNKVVGGADSGFPVLTITARADRVELKHDGGDTGADLGSVARAPIEEFRGRWVEVYMRQVHGENGELEMNIKDMQTGRTIMEYQNDDIDLWRTGATLSRPKFGVYRSKNSVLRDEQVLFANFCVSESAESFCPGEAIVQPDTEAPSAPSGLTVTGTSFTTIDLEWEASTDDFGVTAYQLFQDDALVATVTGLDTTVANLASGTSFDFYVRAIDAAGNASAISNTVTAATDDVNALPGVATNPTPADGATEVNPRFGLAWTAGNNTDEFEVFLGTTTDPPSIGTQTGGSAQPELTESTTYYWRVDATNSNGTTSSPLWSFTTGSSNADFPWDVFRGNARPEVETSFWSLNTAPAAAPVDEVVADPSMPSNNFYGFRSTENDNFKWRYDLSAQDTTVTIVARIRGVRADVSSLMHIEVRMAGVRQKVRINKSNVKLERSSPAVDRDVPFNWNDDFHLVRIVVENKFMSVYLDEEDAPFLTASTAEGTDRAYVEFGKSGGADYGSMVDWFIVQRGVAQAPGEGAALPADLLLGDFVNTFSPALQSALQLFPNPANESFTLLTPPGAHRVRIFSADGRVASPLLTVSERGQVDVSKLTKGLYFVLVRSAEGSVARMKLIKQ
ncbi:T9SS type A sorting domain-containing protein [Lewinella sp. 4G2]|uniref:T9SS type A sorting domain-containing protein n=1 Tax=Lewinella sp. 4G2 TaxID=1803372 RepID=UPI0007B4E60A|nr:T9SS type A sorting domain-containing protein [Lewinella sp. 4G2]OAV43127.1 hypothetical protein A3850_000840 [Lewinella sp. 4G2]